MARVALPDAFLARPIAHRALHDLAAGRQENSRAAVRAAVVAAGYGIEIDLQLSADGVPMVFHDEALDRLTRETGPLNARTAAALAAIRLRVGDEGIPTLAEVLAEIGGPRAAADRDQGSGRSAGPERGYARGRDSGGAGGLCRAVAVMSFNPHSIAAMARAAPALPRGLTTSAYDPAEWAPVPADRCAELRGDSGL